jgi:UDP-glucose 4-epimerase
LKILVIGGAGFIGSHLAERLLSEDHAVTVVDNLSSGKRAFLPGTHRGLRFYRMDVLTEARSLEFVASGHDAIVHLAANPDARRALTEPRVDLEQGTISTFIALEAARLGGVPHFVFASSGTVYGDAGGACAEKDLGHLPISLYGASKLAGEAMVSAYVACFGLSAVILRFANVVGSRATHGAIYDWCRALKEHPDHLDVLGNGGQEKAYLHVSEAVGALDWACEAQDLSGEGPLVRNVGPDDDLSVQELAEWVVALSPVRNTEIRYAGGRGGWRGDVPDTRPSPSIKSGGSKYAVKRAILEIIKEVWA